MTRREGDNYINKDTRINHSIRAEFLRVLGEDGSQLGVLSKRDAIARAEEAGLDLVEIAADASPPVAKIVDWGKFNYQREKQLQKNRRNSKVSELKQMRFGLKISDHDMGVKLRKVSEFLADGNKVRLTVVYRGRELAHKEIGYTLINRLIETLGEGVVADQAPQFAGKQLSTVVRSTNAKAKVA